MSIRILGNVQAEWRRTHHLDHALCLLCSYRYIIDFVLIAQVTHDLLRSIKQLTQVREEAVTPAKKIHTYAKNVLNKMSWYRSRRRCYFRVSRDRDGGLLEQESTGAMTLLTRSFCESRTWKNIPHLTDFTLLTICYRRLLCYYFIALYYFMFIARK